MTSPRTTTPSTASTPRSLLLAVLGGATAMMLVGGSVAVNATLRDAPAHTAQGLRYALACALLLGWARLRRQPVLLPRPREWGWLTAVSVTGLVVFNIALVEGAAHAEPAVLAVAVACVPIMLGALGPVLEGSRPRTRVMVAAVVVTAGAAVVQGLGRSDSQGLVFALVVLACEAGFTLLAVPVLRRHGALGVSLWTTAIAAVVFTGLGVGLEGPTAITRLSGADLIATGYLAVCVTAVAFVLWYGAVQLLGAGRAGLLTGIAPLSAAAVGAVVLGQRPDLGVWVGLVLVTGGLAIGLGGRSRRSRRSTSWQDRADTLENEGARPCPERTSPAPRRPIAPPSSAPTATTSCST